MSAVKTLRDNENQHIEYIKQTKYDNHKPANTEGVLRESVRDVLDEGCKLD